MRPAVTVVFLAALLAGCSTTPAQDPPEDAVADDGKTTLTIAVTDVRDGRPIDRARVEVRVPGVGSLSKTTDDEGRAVVTLRPATTCLLTTSKAGYDPDTSTVGCLEDGAVQVGLARATSGPSSASSSSGQAPRPPESGNTTPPVEPEAALAAPATHVVVATFDTGVNPFHPAWRTSRDPAHELEGLPADAVRVPLQLTGSYAADWGASQAAWTAAVEAPGLVLFEGTRTLGVAAADDPTPFLDQAADDHYHGARASTQIAGSGYGIADHAWVVALDLYGGTERYEPFIRAHVGWLAEQDWIDVVHVNFGFPAPWPGSIGLVEEMKVLVDAGKIVVLPALNGAGNGGAPYPMEFGQLTSAPGTLVAGANDQCAAGGYWSNLNPHVVMDGSGTVAGASRGYGNESFSGTSSASPRTAGYVAEVLYQARLALGYTHGMREGALIQLEDGQARPATGPLSDGRLDAAELHETVRKTAQAGHASWMDGSPFLSPCPAFPEQEGATYSKVGYGEVSEHTLQDAVAVLLGQAEMPERPDEDRWYEASEALRHTIAGG